MTDMDGAFSSCSAVVEAERHLMRYSPTLDTAALGSLVDDSAFILPLGCEAEPRDMGSSFNAACESTASSAIPNPWRCGEATSLPISISAATAMADPIGFPPAFSELPLDQIDGIQDNRLYSHAFGYHPAFYAGPSSTSSLSHSLASGASVGYAGSIPSAPRCPPHTYVAPAASALRACSLSYEPQALVNPSTLKASRRGRSASAVQLSQPPLAASMLTDDTMSTTSEAGMPIEKRLSHIQNEKRRRINMQEAFKNLQNSVPQTRDRKVCRATLLSEAVAHIRWLKWQQGCRLGLRVEPMPAGSVSLATDMEAARRYPPRSASVAMPVQMAPVSGRMTTSLNAALPST